MVRLAQSLHRETPLAGLAAAYKRVFDFIGAMLALAVFAIPMILIALAIKIGDRGPILYRQRRISLGARDFTMIKFRTMIPDAEAAGPAFAVPNDPRCTRVGRWLRANSLDELPQLFNVIAGQMSLVGPRPERPEMLSEIQRHLPNFHLRFHAKAGITGFAQIHGFRGGKGGSAYRKRLQYDLYYLNNWSPLFDIKILLATIFGGFRA